MTAVKKPTNERLEVLQMNNVATVLNATAAKKLEGLLREINDTLKRVEAKKTLHLRLTQEERAVWILFGKKK